MNNYPTEVEVEEFEECLQELERLMYDIETRAAEVHGIVKYSEEFRNAYTHMNTLINALKGSMKYTGPKPFDPKTLKFGKRK